MGLKKYEIITVGSDKRVRALRSWQVGDRYVNIGDLGGIVYDEKTLSQDGACWLFRGNFGFPGARIGGDSIVDVGEAALNATGAPAVDILGSSVVVGSKLQIAAEQTAENAVVLTEADFEQGTYGALIAGSPLTKVDSGNYVRLKNPFFAGGKTVTLKCEVPGYLVTAIALDRDGFVITNAPTTATGVGVTITVPAGQYFTFRMSKDPVAATVPADAAAAQITFTGTYETKLSIIDSRVEINPATSTGILTLRPGGTYTMSSGVKYPEAVIRNSKVSLSVPAADNRVFRLMGRVIGSTAVLDSTAGNLVMAGTYSSVKSLRASGELASGTGVSAYDCIQATNCNDFATSPTIFPGLAAAIAANMPFIFQGCNVPNGIFYHHAQIKNTYVNIDFAKASADLGKAIASGQILASAEVEGMYRLYSTTGSVFGALVEAHDSVKSLNMADGAATYGTTIYKDAYLNGLFDIAGTNVFGNKVRSHPLAQVLNLAPRSVQGGFNTANTPPTVVPEQTVNTVMNVPLRINGVKGLKVENVPAGVRYMYVILDANLKFIKNSGWHTGTSTVNAGLLQYPYAMITFNRESGSTLTPEDLAGVTVTVYNGCKIVNTGEAAVAMKGNIRVEDNATLVNASITGSGYFGGNCVASGLILNGCAFMGDNAILVNTSEGGTMRRLYMRDNSRATISALTVFGLLDLRDNAVFSPVSYGVSEADIIMRDNAIITSGLSANGVVTMKDNAKVSGGKVTIAGDITLCGSYNQTVSKAWTGKRTITDVNAPEYDNNVKTKYDF